MNERSFINKSAMVYYNNDFIESEKFSLTSANRAFKYGDGLFESALILNKKTPLIKYNLQRLKKGMGLLGINYPSRWTIPFFDNLITQLADSNDLINGRCRTTVWREGSGLYLPASNEPELLIEVFSIDEHPLTASQSNLLLGVYVDYPKMIHPLSSCKTANAIPYILAANYAKSNGYNDVLLLNTNGGIADAINSNIFIVKNNTYYTTELMNGGVEGTMQEYLLANAGSLGIKINRIPMNINDVLSANEVMLSNAIHGIKPVSQFQDVVYTNNFSTELLGKLKWLLEQDAM